jgi:muramoyltetrapeptide carboxypeptidase
LPFSVYIRPKPPATENSFLKATVKILRPPPLRKHDIIAIVAPASAPSSPEKIEKGVRYLERLGYRVEVGKHAKDIHGYFAGKDVERASDLNGMFRDKRVKAIFVVRGGYGAPRLLERIDYSVIKRNPKILVGYSDVTALQLAIFKRTGLVTFSGPMLAVEMFEKMDAFTEDFIWRMLTSKRPIGKVSNPPNEPLKPLLPTSKRSSTGGRLLGGNLSMIVSLMGTPFLPDFSRNILFFEEVGEEPYRIDRMLTQLKLGGVLRSIGAMIIGSFVNCLPADKKRPTLTIKQILEELTVDLEIPILSGLAYGHRPQKLTLPIGVRARVDTDTPALEFLESGVE